MNVQVKSTVLPPFRPLPQKAPDVDFRKMPDGTMYIAQRHSLGQMHRSIAHLFAARAKAHPARNFIGERTPLDGGKTGDWRFIAYGEMHKRAQALAQVLLNRGMHAGTQLSIL